jgi:hypothetical protein
VIFKGTVQWCLLHSLVSALSQQLPSPTVSPPPLMTNTVVYVFARSWTVGGFLLMTIVNNAVNMVGWGTNSSLRPF